MEEFADTKEDENKKIVHTYPLVQVSVPTSELMLSIYDIPNAYIRILIGRG
jgi:hypothetical protein